MRFFYRQYLSISLNTLSSIWYVNLTFTKVPILPTYRLKYVHNAQIQYYSSTVDFILFFNMLKVKQSNNSKLKKYVEEFSENIFSTDGLVLYFKSCDVKVLSEKKFHT